jgi:DNA (cytosine-5)-methyltransferase 1
MIKQSEEYSNSNKLNVVDLFCGCGGLSKGFEEAGYNILIGVDNDVDALNTFKLNHNGALTANLDLSGDEFLSNLESSLNGKTVDIVLAGPPCQGFSLTGPRQLDDPRNSLYMAVFKTVSRFSPKAFVIENVFGLKTMWKGAVLKEIIEKFSNEIGYDVVSSLVNMAEYGVAQFRKRVFIVGINKELNKQFQFPSPTHDDSNFVTCSDAISDLPSRENDLGNEEENYLGQPATPYQQAMNNGCGKLFNHVGSAHRDFVKKTIAMVPEGGNYKDLPKGVGTSRRFNEAWTRYHSEKPSRTIDTGHRNHFHYKWNRVPTVRENARLQSFRDDFAFTGSKTRQNFQVGNAVPPLFASILAKEIRKIIG